MADIDLTPAFDADALLQAAMTAPLPEYMELGGWVGTTYCGRLALVTLRNAVQGSLTEEDADKWFQSYAAALGTGTAHDLLELADCAVESAIRDGELVH